MSWKTYDLPFLTLKKTIYVIIEEVDALDDYSRENANRIEYIGFTETLSEAEMIVSKIKEKSSNREIWIQEIIKIKLNK